MLNDVSKFIKWQELKAFAISKVSNATKIVIFFGFSV